MKVRCIKTFTLKGVLHGLGGEYDVPAKEATDYAEYFEKVETKQTAKPKNKAKKTEENK